MEKDTITTEEIIEALHELYERIRAMQHDDLDATLRSMAIQQRARAARDEPLSANHDYEPHIFDEPVADPQRCGWCGQYNCTQHNDLDPYAV